MRLSERSLNIYLYLWQYKPKGVQLGGFGGQFACSRAGTDTEIMGGGGGGGGSKPDWRLSRPLLTFYRVFQLTIPMELKFLRREGGVQVF